MTAAYQSRENNSTWNIVNAAYDWDGPGLDYCLDFAQTTIFFRSIGLRVVLQRVLD